MVKASSIPTPLIARDDRPAVEIAPVPTTSPFPEVKVAARLLWWIATILWLRLTRRGSPAEYGRRTRLILEDLGGLWIKAGQLLSMRVDLFSIEFCRELSHLQVKAIGFPPAEAMRAVEADLGGPLSRLFREFDEAPLAAASMGQVHLARLRESSTRVAVKVQRPHLPWTFAYQLRVIRWIATLLEWARFRPHMRWGNLIWELNQIMLEEMDCRYEASSTRRMRRTLKAHGIYAPKVFYATRRVLVTEFIDGVLMADYIQTLSTSPERLAAWLAENRIDPKAVGDRLARSLLRQLLEDDLYHGDLHPGNIMLLRDNRVALIDFGTSSFTEREYLERFRLATRALSSNEYAKVVDLLLLMCGALPNVDVDMIREQLLGAMRRWVENTEVPELPYHQKSLAFFYNETGRIFYEHHCTIDWTLLRIRRALETLDASQMYLIPDVNCTEIPRTYFREAGRRAMASTSLSDSSAASLLRVRAGFETTEQLEEYMLFQSEIIRRSAQVFRGATNKAVDLLSTAVSQLAIVAVAGTSLAVAAFLAQHQPQWLAFIGQDAIARLSRLLPPLDWQLWALLVGASAYGSATLMRVRGRLRRTTRTAAG
jgi:ubiquinone biosynthesis protein